MLQRNIDRLQWLLVVFVFVVVIIPIVVTVIVGRIADGCLVVIVVIVARASAMRSTAVGGHQALGARSHNDGKLDHAGGMRRF